MFVKALADKLTSTSVRSQNLSNRIHDEIAATGPMRFSRFMELALYDSLEGYYVSDRLKVGREGDFFTNVSVGPVFGEILAGQFLEMWSILGEPNDFTIVEQGANDGQLARDVIMALAGTPLESARWIIVEPLESLRVKQSHLLENAHVCWVSSSYYLPPFCGVHFSNELFDALPFDIIEAHDGKWRELLVDSQGEDFVFCPNPNFIVETPLPPRPDGFLTECRQGQKELFQGVSSAMQKGFLLAIDYGMPCEDFLADHRSKGTLACYSKHRRDENPLTHPGQKDITAHVDFSSLARDANAVGMSLSGFTDQHHFLVGAATNLLQSMDGKKPSPVMLKKLRSLRMLLHPETMGAQFKVILFSKDAPESKQPSGFLHAKDPGYLLENP